MGNIDILEDACDAIPHTTRRMFGGHGLFAPNGGMFAGIVTDDKIILKFAIGEPDHDAFRALGAEPWVYDNKMTMKEWLVVPDELYDEPRQLAAWCARAHKVAPGKALKKPAAKKAAAKQGTAKPASTEAAARPPAPKAPPARKPAPKAAAPTKAAAKRTTKNPKKGR